MRIDPTYLFSPPSPSAAAQRSVDLIQRHGFKDGENQEYHALFTSLFHTPSAWFFEHDGWLVGGVGGFEKCEYYNTENSHIFLCKEGFASLVQPEVFSRTLKGMQLEGLTDAGSFLDRLTDGVTPQHFMEGFSKRSCRTGTYLAQPSAGPRAGKLAYHSPISFDKKDHPCQEDILSRVSGHGGFRFYHLPHGSCEQAEIRSQVKNELLELLSSQVATTGSVLRKALNSAAVDAAEGAGALNLRLVAWLSLGNTQRRIQALESNPGTLGGLVLEYWKPWVPRSRPSSMVEDFTDDEERLKTLQRGERVFHTMVRQGMARLGQLIDEGQPWYAFVAQWITQMNQAMGVYVDEQYPQEILRGLQRVPRLPPEQRPTLATCRAIDSLHPYVYDSQRTTLDLYHTSPAAMIAWLCGVLEVADIPKSPDQWAALRETMGEAISADQQSVNGHREHAGQPKGRTLAAFRRYRHTLKGIAQPPQASDWLVPYGIINDLAMAREEIEAWVRQAYGLSRAGASSVLNEVWTMKQWLEASKVLHRLHRQATERQAANQAKAMAAFHEGKQAGLWPAGDGLPEQITLDGIVLTALLHPLALLKEGEDMGHCVAGFSQACFSGRSRIYSMLNPETQERATLELTLSIHVPPLEQPGRIHAYRSSFAYPEMRTMLRVVPRQIRGPHNQSVSESMH